MPCPQSARSSPIRAAYAPPSLQSVTRDFAFVVDDTLAAGDLLRAVAGADKANIIAARLFDRFTGDGVAAGQAKPGRRNHPTTNGQKLHRRRSCGYQRKGRRGGGEIGRGIAGLNGITPRPNRLDLACGQGPLVQVPFGLGLSCIRRLYCRIGFCLGIGFTRVVVDRNNRRAFVHGAGRAIAFGRGQVDHCVADRALRESWRFARRRPRRRVHPPRLYCLRQTIRGQGQCQRGQPKQTQAISLHYP